jgi:predicted metalloprotease
MKWKPGKRSPDLQDRRSGGGGGGGGGLPGGTGAGSGGLPIPIPSGGGGKGGMGIGTIIVMVIIYLVFIKGCGGDGGTGINVPDTSAFPQTPANGKGKDSVPKGPDPEAQEVDFVNFVLTDVQGTWEETFQAAGKPYQHAQLVLYRDATNSGCGQATSDVGPFYCPLDQTVYLDLGFFDELNKRFKAPGDFAQAYVIAHELGHHVQQQLGIEQKVRDESEANPDDANDLSVRLELQADCLAGAWGRSAYTDGVLETGDLEEGLTAAAAVGDDRIQEQTQGRIDPESFTHGTSEQRDHWLQTGFDNGTIEACDTFSGDV